MADDTTKITISLETVLKNLNQTLRGLDAVKKRLDSIAATKLTTQSATATNRATVAAQKLSQQQQKLNLQSQELANRQERARQVTERLALSQQRLAQTQQRVTQISRGLNIQQDRHVQVFRAMERASQSFNRTLNALGNSLRSIGQGFASFGATLSVAVSAPLAAMTVNIVDAAVRMDSLRRGLITIAGSSELAAIQLQQLTEIAKLPGIGFEEAIQGSIALQAVGFSAQEAEKALVQFSNAVALTGGSREQLQTITVQLGQMAAQSKVLAADLKPIINAAPAVAVALRNAFGTVRSEEIQELGIASKDFIDIMIKELAKLPRATAGARNSFDNFRDSVFRAAATIGESLLPALVRLTTVLEPIITGLANTFAVLPAPIQSTVFVLGALAIALGPFTFIFGQLITGLGRVVVGFAQLNAIGLLPTIANFRLLGQVMIGTASLAQGAAATAALAAVGWAALAGAVVAIVGIAAAIATLSIRNKEHVETTEEQVRATEASLKILRAQRETLSKVTAETEAVANSSDELKTIYRSLNRESQGRVTILQREVGLTRALRDEVARLIVVREGEQRIQAATTAASIATTAEQITNLGQRIDTAIDRVTRLQKARESLLKTGRLPQGFADPLLSSIASLDSVRQLEQIDKTLSRLTTERLPDLRKQSDDATAALSRQSAQLQQLEEATGRSTREILEQAKSYGLFKGDVESAALGIEAFRKAQVSLEAALSGTTEEVIRQRLELRKLSGPADEAQKQRRLLIDAAIDFARENSSTIDEAKKKLDEFADKFPEVRKAIEDEIKKRPIEEFLREFAGRKGKGRATSETSLRNAQQQLADAVAQVALASKEREVEIELDRNAALQRAAEVGQRLRLLSYQEYLETRAQLTTESLDKEIDQQQRLVAVAQLAQARLLQAAQQAGIPAAERTRRQAQAAQANEEAIRAETRLILLQNQRERVQSELTQELKLAQDQQLKDTIQLEIAFGELQGKIQDAMDIAAVEEFRETLQDLAKAQDFLNKQIEKARKLRQAERVQSLQQQQAANQRQIEAIQNTVKTRQALAELAAAEKLVENAKERQQQLEAELAFQVQFRGLSEEESIRRRLEGEQRLQSSMELSKSIVEELQQRLSQLGVTPPPELQKFIDGLKRELLGLGELTFIEQFRLAEKEFQRLNDERVQKIQDVERAVRNADIAHIEGFIAVRRINGEHIGDLEKQLALLKAIAKESKDESLKQRAADIGETVKDAKDKVADLDRQLRAVSIDSLQDSLGQLFKDLRDNSQSALEDILNFLSRIGDAISDMIAENLAKELIESLFPDPSATGGGIVGFFKRMLGIGGESGVEAVAHGADAVEHGATTVAATTLTTGATAAATALTTGGATAGTALITSATAAAASFAATVVAAGAAFAAAVGVGQATGGLGSLLGGAATGLFPAVPGGAIRILEGGYPEAVLTTDPRYAAKQVNILRELLAKTRGFYGRLPGFATGGIVSRETAEAQMLSAINRAPQFLPSLPASAMETAGGVGTMSLRIVNQVTSRELARPYLTSEEGVRDVLNIISTHSNEVVRRLPRR